jgi:hypothetical protein
MDEINAKMNAMKVSEITENKEEAKIYCAKCETPADCFCDRTSHYAKNIKNIIKIQKFIKCHSKIQESFYEQKVNQIKKITNDFEKICIVEDFIDVPIYEKDGWFNTIFVYTLIYSNKTHKKQNCDKECRRVVCKELVKEFKKNNGNKDGIFINGIKNNQVIEKIKKLSNNFKNIIGKDELTKNNLMPDNGNGIGDRFMKRIFTYSAVYGGKKPSRQYLASSTLTENPLTKTVEKQFKKNKPNKQEIIGIYIHGINLHKPSNRPIKQSIKDIIVKKKCVHCAKSQNIVCDHKNDLYNDKRVLNVHTQRESDFQPLCNACNLQKRSDCEREKATGKLIPAKVLYPKLCEFNVDFLWEQKEFNINDPNCKVDTYWYDPLEFMRKIQIAVAEKAIRLLSKS